MTNNSQQSLDIRDILAVTSQLTQLLSQETVLMKQMKIVELGALQDKKHELVSLLEKYKSAITQQPSLLSHLSPEERVELKQASIIFDSVANENYNELLLAQKVNSRVIEIAAKSLKKHLLSSHANYGENGGMDIKSGDTPSLAINENI